MFQSTKLACGQILGLALLCTTASAYQQAVTSVEPAKSAAFAIVEKAFQWMPESFRRVMTRNLDGLRDGTIDLRAERLAMTSERLTLEEELLQRMATTVNKLQSRPRFSQVAKEFGALAQIVLLLNLPEVEAHSSDKLLALKDVIGRNSSAFRVVVYDASEIGGSQGDVRSLLEAVRQRRKNLSERFGDVQATHSLTDGTVPLDPRSPLYGVAALVYSHAINDTARVWLWIWRSANGDMSGRPSLPLPQ